MKSVWSLFAGLIALGLTTAPASATTCGVLGVNTVLYTTTGTSSCFATGNGQINSPDDDPFGPLSPLLYLDKSGAGGGLADGALTITPGQWSISPPSGYTNFVLLFQQSNSPNKLPNWAAFVLSGNFGTWLMESLNNSGGLQSPLTLSHAILYGVADPTQTPLPGALVLFGTVLLGSGGIARWRKRRERMVG
jgi:hypothetical protein